MPLKVYLVDDENLALKRLSRLLLATKRVEIIGSTTDPELALEFLSHQDVDLLFLDIQMPEINGFELLAKLPKQPLVVFTTAFDQYALQAFQVNAIDYLLKPIEATFLDRALDKMERLFNTTSKQNQETEMQILAQKLAASFNQSQVQYLERIPSKVGDLIQLIDINQISHFFAEDKLTYAATINKNYVIDYTITDLEQRLDPKKFLRIHRATIVNLSFIQELDSWFVGRMVLRLKDGKKTELVVARDRVRLLKDCLGL